MKSSTQNKIKEAITLAIMLVFFISSTASAQNVNTLTSQNGISDPTQSTFQIVVCDGPTLPADLKAAEEKKLGRTYIPCDFNGAMMQVQHLIDIAMVLGVFAAIVLFTYAGYLLLTGTEANRNKAKDIFPKIFWGFIIMLSAWFIVYQILNWLTGSSSPFTKLLGNP
jgi:hypothetical protein